MSTKQSPSQENTTEVLSFLLDSISLGKTYILEKALRSDALSFALRSEKHIGMVFSRLNLVFIDYLHMSAPSVPWLLGRNRVDKFTRTEAFEEVSRMTEIFAETLSKKGLTPLSRFSSEDASPWLNVALENEWWSLLGYWRNTDKLSFEDFSEIFSTYDYPVLLSGECVKKSEKGLPLDFFNNEEDKELLCRYRKEALWLSDNRLSGSRSELVHENDLTRFLAFRSKFSVRAKEKVLSEMGKTGSLIKLLTQTEKKKPSPPLIRRLSPQSIASFVLEDPASLWEYASAWVLATGSSRGLETWLDNIVSLVEPSTLHQALDERVPRLREDYFPSQRMVNLEKVVCTSAGRFFQNKAKKTLSPEDYFQSAFFFVRNNACLLPEKLRFESLPESFLSFAESQKTEDKGVCLLALGHACLSWDSVAWDSALPRLVKFLKESDDSDMHYFLAPLMAALKKSLVSPDMLPYVYQALLHASCFAPRFLQDKVASSLYRKLQHDKNVSFLLPRWDLLVEDLEKLSGDKKGPHCLSLKLAVHAAQNEHRPSKTLSKM